MILYSTLLSRPMESRSTAIKEIIVGAIVGIAGMLPGISGAVLCVCFGIYERLVRDIAKLRIYIKKDFWFIFFLGVGAVIGTVFSAKVLSIAMDAYPTESLFLFVGLIAGQIPSVYRLTTRDGNAKPTTYNIIALIIGFIIMGSMLAVDLFGSGTDVTVDRDLMGMLTMFGIGIIVAVSSLIPGISHSTFLIVFGLFTVFTNTVGNLDIPLLIPLGLGAIFGFLGFSKVVHYALEHHHRTTSFLILGLTVGSIITLAISSGMDVDGIAHAIGGLVTFIIGMIVSLWFVKKSEMQQIFAEETE